MNRVILTSAALILVSGAQANIIFSDGFESGDFSKWTHLSNGEPEIPQIYYSPFPVYEGLCSAFVRHGNSGGTQAANQWVKLIDPIPASHTFTFTFYLSLNSLTAGVNQWMEIRSFGKDGNGNGITDQILAIGAVGGSTSTMDANGNVIPLNTTDHTKWNARIGQAGYPGNGWFALDLAPARTKDWTKLSIVVAPDGIEFFVNDVKGHHSTFSRGTYANWTADAIYLGSGRGSTGSSGWVDNVLLTAVPEPASMIVLGIGALALVRYNR